MIKWFTYIVFTLVLMPYLLHARSGLDNHTKQYPIVALHPYLITGEEYNATDTVKTPKSASKNNDSKVKEVAKAKRQPKPEKVGDNNQGDATNKNKRQRRPDGMERPPEIPRRNDN